MAAPTPVSALVHSRTLVIGGIVVLFKHPAALLLGFKSVLVITVGSVTIFLSRFAAAVERDFKKIVAMSTLRQLGIMFCVLGSGVLWLIIFHLLSHAVFKRLLFMGVGAGLKSNEGFQRSPITQVGGFLFYFFVVQLCLISLSGLLFLCGFFSKDIFIESSGRLLLTVSCLLLILRVGLTLVYSYKMFVVSISSVRYGQRGFSGSFLASRVGLLGLVLLFGWGFNKMFVVVPLRLVSVEKFARFLFVVLVVVVLIKTSLFLASLFLASLLFSPQETVLNKIRGFLEGGILKQHLLLKESVFVINSTSLIY